MIPILFNAGETAFKTNGLGRLSDALSCSVTEERNGSYELEMKYPVDGIHYSDISYGKLILALPSEDAIPQPFEIYLITRPMNQQVTIKAEHISYRMKYIPVTAFSANDVNGALSGLKSNAVCDCPFVFSTDKTNAGTFTMDNPQSMRSLLAENDGSIIDVFGGEWEFDRFKAILHKERGSDNGVTLRYGKNLTTLEQEENIQDMVTGIYPYMRGDNDEIIEVPNRVMYTAAKDFFPYQRILPVEISMPSSDESEETKTVTTTTVTVDPSTSRIHTETKEETITIKKEQNPTSLQEQAQLYIDQNGIGVPKVSLKVGFAELWNALGYEGIAKIEKVHLCDTVTVEFLKLGVDAKAKVTKTVFDVLNERYSSIEVGDSKPTLNSVVQGNVRSSQAQISARLEQIRSAVGKTKTGDKSVTVSGTNKVRLFTNEEVASALSIDSDKATQSNVSVQATNSDTAITTPISTCAYDTDGWYITFTDNVTGTVKVTYTIKYLGG